MNPTLRATRSPYGVSCGVSCLILWAWLSLTGCPAPTPVSPSEEDPAYAAVQFDVEVPLETPVSAALWLQGEDAAFKGPAGRGLELIYQGGHLFTAKTRVRKDQAVSFQVRMTAPDAHVPLTRAGTVQAAGTHTAHEADERVVLRVERWGPPQGTSGPRTVFLVAVPATTAPRAPVWLSGNEPGLGQWNPAGVKLHAAMDSLYAVSLSFTAGTALQFKATLGCWETVERDAMGKDINNREFTTGEEYEQVALTVEKWTQEECPPPPESKLTGLVQFLSAVTPSDPLLPPRDVVVWLPPGYADKGNTTRYPVLYMHDGQNLVDAQRAAFGVEWNVDETAQALVQGGEVQPLIIVGIYNAGLERINEYTPVPAKNYEQAGRADAYGDFLVKELKPRIDREFRTRPEAEHTGLAGSSLGGLVSLYLGMRHPDTFTRLGVISPSVWWAERDILQRVRDLPGKLPLRIWEDIGTDEGTGEEAETVQDAQDLYAELRAKGWSDEDLKLRVVDGAQHNEAAWSKRFGDVLRFLFPAAP